jgi:hypothetical protein
MKHKTMLAPAAALLALAASAAPAAAAVSIRVEGKTRTLLQTKSYAKVSGTVRKAGHTCPGDTVAGLLSVATRNRWSGTWYSSFNDFEVTKILGELDSYTGTKSYWELFVNNRVASAGVCSTTLTRNEHVLFAAVPATGTEYPLGIRAVTHTTAHGSVTVTVVRYDAKGKAHPLRGATVTLGKAKVTTGAAGTAVLHPTKAGKYTIRAAKAGYIRDEATLQVRR